MKKIYKITNTITGESYIGQTKMSLKERIHNFKAHQGCRKLIEAYEKYGRENFIAEIIEICDDNIADEREDYYINFFDTINNGYNIYSGGIKGHKVSNETKKILREINLGKHHSPKTEFKKGMKPTKSAIKKGEHRGLLTEFTSERTTGVNNPRAYGVYQYTLNYEFVAYYSTAKEASEITKINRGRICNCRCGTAKTAGGYIWIKEKLSDA